MQPRGSRLRQRSLADELARSDLWNFSAVRWDERRNRARRRRRQPTAHAPPFNTAGGGGGGGGGAASLAPEEARALYGATMLPADDDDM